MKNKNRGITLVVLIITIVIALIITATVIMGINNSSNKIAVENMKADIEILEDKVLLYYNQYSQAPTKGEQRTDELLKFIDTGEYYEIDLNKLDNLTLNYGYKKDGENDIYVINTSNLRVYYLAGIEDEGEKYYSFETLGKATVKVEIEGEGSIEGANTEGTQYSLTGKANLTATPTTKNINGTEVSYTFGGWYVNGQLMSTELTYKPIVTKDITYTAVFIPNYSLIYYLDGNNQEQVILDNNTTLVGYKDRTDITKVEVGSGCTTIGTSAFQGCISLATINLPGNLRELLLNSFRSCTSLKKISIPDGCSMNAHYIFMGCNSIESVSIPNSELSLSRHFEGCTALEDIVIGSIGHGTTALPSDLLNLCTQNDLTIKIYLPSGQTSLVGESWGARNATIEYYDATTGEKIN